MTIKACFLNHLSMRKTELLWALLFATLTNTLLVKNCLANPVIVQNNAATPNNILPPPPPLSPPNIIIKTKESLAPPENIQPPRSIVQNSDNEYIFNAPNSKKTSYKIEVLGKSNLVLKQVREIEPKAFIKGNIIQVGIFSEEANAMELVKQLTLQGLWVRIRIN